MKKTVLFLGILFVTCLVTQAQEDIFKKHGVTKEPLTLSKGKYKETFYNEEIMQVGTVLINTLTNKVVKFLEEDTTKLAYRAETTSRFLTVDPLAEKYYSWSPYVYCANNPIKFIDPTGMFYDDYYNYKGEYLGTDNKITDNIRIISTKDFNKATANGTKLNDKGNSNVQVHKDLSSKSESIETADLSAKAYSNIFTNILSKTEGVEMGEIHNKTVSVAVFTDKKNGTGHNNPSGDPNQNASQGALKGKSIITATIHKGENSNLNLYSTVSNVQNALGAHEAIGHGQNGWGDATKTHYKVYEFQMSHPSWTNTTPQFKTTINNLYQKYLNPKR